jgi:cytochrome P450
VHVDERGVVFCFAYDDVRAILRDAGRTTMERARSLAGVPGAGSRAAPPTFPLALINRDAPDHTRLRRLFSKAFTPRNIDVLAASMDRQVDALLDALEQEQHETGEPVDLVAGLAFNLPFRVISEMLGMPDADDARIRNLARDVSAASDPVVTKEKLATAVGAYRELSELVTSEVLPWKRRNPADDLLTVLLAATDDGTLTADELLDNVTLLYVAGHETTSGLIGNAVLNLLLHRRELERLHDEPALLPNAIEELNRYESSIQLAWRYVVDDLSVRDVVIPRGAMVFVCVASANRDPQHFGESADRVDLTRADASDHLSFGSGLHFCLGAPLARTEATIAIGTLLRRFPNLVLAAEPRWNRRVTFRSLEQLCVSLA